MDARSISTKPVRKVAAAAEAAEAPAAAVAVGLAAAVAAAEAAVAVVVADRVSGVSPAGKSPKERPAW